MKRLWMVPLILAIGTACPKIERKTYHFDLTSGTGWVKFENIVSDTPDRANNDFMELHNEVIEGTKLEEENPGWRVTRKELIAKGDRLDGQVTFGFDDPARVGLYKHDKRSPWIWCVDATSGETLVSTNGRRIDDVLAGCVAWERKETMFEITVRSSTLLGGEASLLPQFQRFSAGEVLELEDDPMAGLMSGESGASNAFAEEFAAGLVSGMGEAMGLTGTMTPSDPMLATGEIASEAVTSKLGAKVTTTLRLCYQTSTLVDPKLQGTSTLRWTIGDQGNVEALEVDGDLQEASFVRCATDVIKDITFERGSAGDRISWAVEFTP